MTYDGSNRKQVRAKEKEAALAQANHIAYTRQIMATSPGREWMHALLVKCNVFHTPYVQGASDATAFNCGAQNLGLEIFAEVVANAPTEYVLMMQEATIKELLDERRNSDQRAPAGERSDSSDPGRNDQGSGSPTAAGDYDPYAEDGTDDASLH